MTTVLGWVFLLVGTVGRDVPVTMDLFVYMSPVVGRETDGRDEDTTMTVTTFVYVPTVREKVGGVRYDGDDACERIFGRRDTTVRLC